MGPPLRLTLAALIFALVLWRYNMTTVSEDLLLRQGVEVELALSSGIDEKSQGFKDAGSQIYQES